tara:strand:+ start:752 stop:1600 length:849 start_codon:yes stop_codon:yes gene_type:complete
MNYQKVIDIGFTLLSKNKIESAHLDSQLILSKILRKKREDILINLNKIINKEVVKKFNYLLSKRLKNEPIAYILGSKEFWKHKFFVNRSVLIPRPETEHLVEEILKIIKKNESKKILEIGTGSGCIIISLSIERPKCHVTALDVSANALNVAKTNAKMHHLENKIKFINIDIDKFQSYKYDLIVSNPPYINLSDLKRLDDDIKLYEPKLALYGGSDGYREIKKIISKSSKLLKYNGKLVMEIGDKQKMLTILELEKNGFFINKICKDLSGKCRVLIGTKTFK